MKEKGKETKPVTLYQQFISDINSAVEEKVEQLHKDMEGHIKRAEYKLKEGVRDLVPKIIESVTGIDGSWSKISVERNSLGHRMIEKRLGIELDKVLTKKVKQEVLKAISIKRVEREIFSMVKSKISERIVDIAEGLAATFVNTIYDNNFVIQDGEVYICVDGEIKPLTLELLSADDDQLEVIKEQAKTEAYVARLQAKINQLEKLKRDVKKGKLDKVPANIG